MKTVLAAMILSFAGSLAWAYSLAIDPVDTGNIAVVTSTSATPTKVLTKNEAANRTWLINYSTNVIYLVGPSTTSVSGNDPATFSISLTTGSFYLVGASSMTFTPDGAEPYTGAMWAVAGGSGGTSLTRFRSK